MNFLLSVFLCLAMVLSGTGELPAEPEFSTTWTLRNVALDIGADSCALDSEARLTAFAGADRVDLRLELEGGYERFGPISVELAPERLLARFGTGDRAYSLSDATLKSLAGIEAGTLPTLDALGELTRNIGALLGDVLEGGTNAARSGLSLSLAALKTCDGSIEPAQLELDGAGLDGRRFSLKLTPGNITALADELRGCGAPALEDVLNSTLRFINQTGGTNFASYAEAMADYAQISGPELNLEITSADGDPGSRCLVNCSLLNSHRGDLLARVDVAVRPERTALDGYLYAGSLFPSRDSAFIEFNARTDPTGRFFARLKISTAGGSYGLDSFRRGSDLHLSVSRTPTASGLGYGYFYGSFQSPLGQTASVNANWSERRESDDSVTTATETYLYANGERLGRLAFDLNLDNGDPEPLFEGAEHRDLRFDAPSRSAGPEAALTRAWFRADAMKLGLDIRRFAEESGVNALVDALLASGWF